MANGTVKWFNAEKGYGFITVDGDEGGAQQDVFVHYKAIEMQGYRVLEEGQKVEFEIGAGAKGRRPRRFTHSDRSDHVAASLVRGAPLRRSRCRPRCANARRAPGVRLHSPCASAKIVLSLSWRECQSTNVMSRPERTKYPYVEDHRL